MGGDPAGAPLPCPTAATTTANVGVDTASPRTTASPVPATAAAAAAAAATPADTAEGEKVRNMSAASGDTAAGGSSSAASEDKTFCAPVQAPATIAPAAATVPATNFTVSTDITQLGELLPQGTSEKSTTLNVLPQARPFVSTAKTKVETATIQMPINSAKIYDKRRKILESM